MSSEVRHMCRAAFTISCKNGFLIKVQNCKLSNEDVISDSPAFVNWGMALARGHEFRGKSAASSVSIPLPSSVDVTVG